MSTDLARLDLLLRRRGTIGYALGMAVYMFVVVALYPAFKNDVSLNQFTEGKSTGRGAIRRIPEPIASTRIHS
jgi:ABC-2 type transport system permease protein